MLVHTAVMLQPIRIHEEFNKYVVTYCRVIERVLFVTNKLLASQLHYTGMICYWFVYHGL